MEISYYGANCLRLVSKHGAFTIDDNLSELGLKSVLKAGDTALYTGTHEAPSKETKLVIDLPGEYEVSDTSIQGVAAQSHMDEAGMQSATIFKLVSNDLRIVVLGHVYPKLNDSQLEAIGTADVLIVPVGGNGYTLDGIGALELIKEIEPKVVIPTHYADSAVKYSVPQVSLDEALKALSMEHTEPVAKFKVKANELADITQLVILERQ